MQPPGGGCERAHSAKLSSKTTFVVHCTFIVCVQETTQKTTLLLFPLSYAEFQDDFVVRFKTKEGTIRRVPLLNVLYVKYQTRTAFHSTSLSSKTTSSSAPVIHVHALPFARTEKRRKETILVPRIVDTMFF